jgi:diguanylate cyclase (GGDEF)-like protein/PAS domain S-box-containing protein
VDAASLLKAKVLTGLTAALLVIRRLARAAQTRRLLRNETAARKVRRLIEEQNAMLEQRVRRRTEQLRDSEAHLHALINHIPVMVAFIDAQQRHVYANRQYAKCFAPARASIVGCALREILGDERHADIAAMLADAPGADGFGHDWQPFPGVWQHIRCIPRHGAAEEDAGFYLMGIDITERKLAERQIGALNSRLAAHVDELNHVSRALRTLSAGNRSMLHALDEQDLLESACAQIVAAGGYRMACVWYRPDNHGGWLQPMAQNGHAGGMQELRRIRDEGGGDPHARTAIAIAMRSGSPWVVRNLHEDPAYAPWRKRIAMYGCCIALPLRIGDAIIGALAIYSANPDDFSESEIGLLDESADDMAFGIATFRARAEKGRIAQAMHRLTYYDELTGLPNENQLTQQIHAEIESRREFSMLQANVERLRDINEALGFASGDELLRHFGARLRSAAPADATVARLRADEFAIFLTRHPVADAIKVAQRIESSLTQAFTIAGLAIAVSARIGIAHFPNHGASVHELYRSLDTAVNHARAKGWRYAIFDPAYGRRQTKRLLMVSELRQAIDSGQLRLYLQPKVEMESGRVSGAEGLLRWQHAERGTILPEEFIGLAEQTALIEPLTEWVIDTALRLSAAWRADGGALPIAVNLSAVNLRDDSLLDKVRALQAKHGSVPGMLEMELTESMLMDDAEHALHVLRLLRAENIPLHIDDFGTGYSSLSYLQRLPVDCIKIDRSFVHAMLDNEDAARIVRSTIALAHDLGRKVVAEGVETRGHWDRLAEFGCDIAQGFFIAEPMEAERFRDWVERFVPPQREVMPA